MASARTISDRIHMLHEGKIIWEGDKYSIENTENKNVIQFTNGISDNNIN